MRRLSPFLAILAGIGLAAPDPVSAQSQSRPAGGDPALERLVGQVDIRFETFTLDNGLRVVVHEDRKAPIVTLSAWYNVGSKDEPAGQTGFAHLFEHIGLFNGTENMPNGLIEPLRAMGASDWNGTTTFDRTNYFQTVPTAALEQALYLESDRMGHLLGALTQERLDSQRGVVQNEKRQDDNQPYGLAFNAVLGGIFPEGHPYRHPLLGSMVDLDAASLEQLRQWFRDNYGPNNAVLVLAGDIDAATARTLVQRYFGHIPRGPRNDPAEANVPTLAAPVSDRMGDRVANTRVYRVWAVPGLLDEQAVPLDIAASVLGGLASSRLDNELVRRDQSAVAVSTAYIPYHRVGLFFVTVDVKPGRDVESVERRLEEVIRGLVTDGPTADEVRRAATRQVSNRIYNLDQLGGRTGKAVTLAEGMLYAGDAGRYRRELDAYARATPQSVAAVTRRWLTRPVYALRIDPGERPRYEEAVASPRTPAAPSEPIRSAARAPMGPMGQVPNVDFPTIERATLSNGIPIVYARRSGLPIVRLAMEFDAGWAADPANALGTHSLMLNMLSEGTITRNSIRIAEEKERLGTNIFTEAGPDRTAVSLAAISTNLGPSLDLFADIVRNPAFAAAEVDRLRAQQMARVANETTTPITMAQRALLPALYGPSHPYGRSFTGTGDAAAVGALTREDLVAAHQRWIRPDNARIFAVGDVPLSELVRQLESRLGNWRNPSAPRGVKTSAAAPQEGRSRIILIDRPQSPQSMILAGAVLPVSGTDDVLALTTANEVFGGDFLARINQDLRETRGWSYGVHSQLQMMEYRSAILIQAPVQTNQTGPSVAALLDHLRRFTSDRGVTPAELTRVVSGNTRQLAGRFETLPALLGAIRSNAMYRRPDNYWETVSARFHAMTAGTLDGAARQAIDPADFIFVVVGDAAVIRPQLEAVGLPIEQIVLN